MTVGDDSLFCLSEEAVKALPFLELLVEDKALEVLISLVGLFTDCRPRQFGRFKHLCFLVPGPPYFFMSKQ